MITRPAGDRGAPVSKWKKDLCDGVGRVNWKSLKLELDGERDKTRLVGGKPGSS